MQSKMFFMSQLPDDIDDDDARSYDEDSEDDVDDIDNACSYYRNSEDYMKGPHHPHERTTPVKTKQTLLLG